MLGRPEPRAKTEHAQEFGKKAAEFMTVEQKLWCPYSRSG